MIRCKMRECPYEDDRGICLKPILAIDENGMCSVPWYQGRRMDFGKEECLQEKKEEILIDVDFEEVTIEESREEESCGGTGEEDPLSDDRA